MAPAQWTDSDHRFMREALALAHAGIGLVSPNPAVGAVLVKDGKVVGRGTHVYEGRKHAEVLAIEDAGSEARGSTLYLNLEPCSHFGRTGPCADAVVTAGISRVVCAMEDPNPAVAGQGFVRLRAAGVQVEVGLYQDEAQRLNDWFAKFVRTGIPFVTLKAGMSLDAKIAPAPDSNGSPWITSEAARQHAQQLRHAADAIVVGIGTVLADDPSLTDRTGLPRRRSLLRIVLDSHLRTPLTSKLVQSANHDLLICCSPDAAAHSMEHLTSAGAEVIAAPCDWHVLLRLLAERNITSVLIEGGAKVFASALNASVVDKLALYLAPKLLGGEALSAFGSTTTSVPQLRRFRAQRIEDDVLLTGYIRDPYDQIPN
ncbi:MAG TPA: bifunctional diaminohydroxyphosphoribosylaminopyrimidine deaminase/5-amino-6-(5-phosphoribosylamino)uracil reductase RibD [Terriglobales bacterium]